MDIVEECLAVAGVNFRTHRNRPILDAVRVGQITAYPGEGGDHQDYADEHANATDNADELERATSVPGFLPATGLTVIHGNRPTHDAVEVRSRHKDVLF